MAEALSSLLWGWHVLGGILAAGAFFTVATGFYQLRCLGRWMKAALRPPPRQGGKLSSFQALSTALAGSIGTGNIVGVAAAITVGGPGALFWMWLSALLGMMTVYAENYLSAKHPGAPGALGYIRRAGRLGGLLAGVYAVGCCLSSLAMGDMVQVGAAAAALENLGLPVWLSAGGMALLAFWVARGGLSLAGRIAGRLVPAMTLLFFAASLGVLWVFRENLPRAAASIFEGAFCPQAGAGGAAGALLAMGTGISRGVFTNEAGLGSAAFAYQEVEGRTPVELGYMGMFQVFVDTLLLCTVTGLCILCCRSPLLEGAQLTLYAFSAAWGPVGGGAVSLCTALFAVATLVAWSCYGREGLFYLTRGRGGTVYAVGAGVAAALGCLLPLETVLQLGDAMNGLLALPNLTALFLARREVRRTLQEEGRREHRRGTRQGARELFIKF